MKSTEYPKSTLPQPAWPFPAKPLPVGEEKRTPPPMPPYPDTWANDMEQVERLTSIDDSRPLNKVKRRVAELRLRCQVEWVYSEISEEVHRLRRASVASVRDWSTTSFERQSQLW